MNDARDPWSRAQFRSTVAWPDRIRREEPFLNRILDSSPEKSLADLGCGTGEHARHFAAKGWRVTGLDASPDSIEAAVSEAAADVASGATINFVVGDLREADLALGSRFGAAICLGNTIPFLTGPGDLQQAFDAVFRSLLPGGAFVLQLLNYQTLKLRRTRYLPLNFQSTEQGELIYVRLMDFAEGKRVLFYPTTLRLRADDEAPVELLRTHRLELTGWTEEDIVPGLAAAGFEQIELFGTMKGDAFDPATSSDLVAVARRPS